MSWPSWRTARERPLTRQSHLQELADRLELRSVDLKWLDVALAHRSWCAEHPGTESNERLEFLGDAVLGLVVTAHLFAAYPSYPEGELAKIRASVVSSVSLAGTAADIGLGEHLLLGKGEDQSGGRAKRSILADGLEALIGAVYLEGGWDAAEVLVMRLVGERIIESAAGPGGEDYKTRLQEYSARHFEHVPGYDMKDHGPEHAKRFFATVTVGETIHGQGEGQSKKAAEQAAAQAAWVKLESTAAAELDMPAVEGEGEG